MSNEFDWPVELTVRANKPRRKDEDRRKGKRSWFAKRNDEERRSGKERRILPDRRKNPR